MDIALFDYHLPPELIAQFPVRKRDASKLLVLDRTEGSLSFGPFREVLNHLRRGDALVVNNTKVFKARLFGHRPTGARVEVFLVRKVESPEGELWEALVSPSRRVKKGEPVVFDEKHEVLLVEGFGSGRWYVRFHSKTQRERIVARFGHVPLPHYIRRDDQPNDIRRYQTVFADGNQVGAVAAPTAGFHFTPSLLKEIKQKDVSLIELTLHVGPGTFKPVKTADINDHIVDPEVATLSSQAARELNRVRKNGGRVFAVGTTSVRTLESAIIKDGLIQPFSGMVNLYIKPGHNFGVCDHLITNFHLPKSSLLILVSAFAGRERILAAYQEAINRRMRFYSYGDAMLVV